MITHDSAPAAGTARGAENEPRGNVLESNFTAPRACAAFLPPVATIDAGPLIERLRCVDPEAANLLLEQIQTDELKAWPIIRILARLFDEIDRAQRQGDAS